jgi:hypothetical protein
MAKGPIKVTLAGRGHLTLRDSDYVAAGGEGTIYRANDTIIKIYSDPQKMLRDGMTDKVRLLADSLKHPNIVAPQGVVTDGSAPIGFYMPFVDGEPMSRVFTSDFRTRTGFDNSDAIDVTYEMRDIVRDAHASQCVMVDANELNWLVKLGSKGHAPKVIDVDSWAIGRWPATVVMPSIRDWNAKSFDANSDWFGWGILAFQIFTGIHPYKGKADGYKPGDLVQRMKDNVSVFDQRVRLPHAVRNFDCIPGPLLDWFEAEFQQGARSIPPSPLDTTKPAKAARVMRAVTTATGGLVFERVFAAPNQPAIRVYPSGAVVVGNGDLLDMATRKHLAFAVRTAAEVIKTPYGWVVADVINGKPAVLHIDRRPETVTFEMPARRFFSTSNRLFAVTDRELMELQLRILGNKPSLTVWRRWTLQMNSTAWFDGVAVQDVMGAKFIFLPVTVGAVQPRVKELDDINVVSGFAQDRFAAFIGLHADGTYRKVELYFDAQYQTYKAWEGGADSPDLNTALLPNGVGATIVDDGELVLYVPSNGKMNRIADKQITTAMRLTAWQDKLIYIDDGHVWRARTNPGAKP